MTDTPNPSGAPPPDPLAAANARIKAAEDRAAAAEDRLAQTHKALDRAEELEERAEKAEQLALDAEDLIEESNANTRRRATRSSRARRTPQAKTIHGQAGTHCGAQHKDGEKGGCRLTIGHSGAHMYGVSA